MIGHYATDQYDGDPGDNATAEDRVRCRHCNGDGLDDPRHGDRFCRYCDGDGKVTRGTAYRLGWLS